MIAKVSNPFWPSTSMKSGHPPARPTDSNKWWSALWTLNIASLCHWVGALAAKKQLIMTSKSAIAEGWLAKLKFRWHCRLSLSSSFPSTSNSSTQNEPENIVESYINHHFDALIEVSPMTTFVRAYKEIKIHTRQTTGDMVVLTTPNFTKGQKDENGGTGEKNNIKS